jgi:hypothetical protein
MKLNFWQWLGVVLLVLGAFFYIMERTTPTANPPSSTTTPTSLPASSPASLPATEPAPLPILP